MGTIENMLGSTPLPFCITAACDGDYGVVYGSMSGLGRQRTVSWDADTNMGVSSETSEMQKVVRPLPMMFLSTAASRHLSEAGPLFRGSKRDCWSTEAWSR